MCVFRNSPHLPHHRADLLFYQLKWNLNTKSWTQRVTMRCINELARSCVQICVKSKRKSTYESFRKCLIYRLWSHLGLNQGPPDYESDALTNWAIGPITRVALYAFWLVLRKCSAKVMLFGDVCNFTGNFSQYFFIFRGVFGLWSGLSWWVGVVCGRLFFLRGVEVAKMPIRWRNTDEMVSMWCKWGGWFFCDK